jgi:ribosomal protein L11 methyltransferase
LAETPRTWPALDLEVDGPISSGLDDEVALALDEAGVTALEPAGRGWRVYFATPRDRARAATSLAESLGAAVSITSVDVPDEGWATKVQSQLGAVEVGGLIVCPPWDRPVAPSADSRVVVIEPSTGFGTGHHQSTRLCLHALQRLDLEGRRVLDVGTGSGVLAIAARLLGAAEVLGFDSDPDAVASARENAARNGLVEGLAFRVDDLASFRPAPADVVLANLTVNLLRRLAGPLASLVAPAGRLVASGFTADQVPLVLDAFPDLEVACRDDEDDWVGLTLGRPR